MSKILIAGLGDKLRGDDGLGNIVIEELKRIKLPKEVDIEDFGSGVFSLIDKLKKYDKIIIIDAIKKGGKPGKIYKAELKDLEKNRASNLHEIKIDKVVLFAKAKGLKSEIIFIGCEPKNLEVRVGLSKEVREAIPKIIDLVFSCI